MKYIAFVLLLAIDGCPFGTTAPAADLTITSQYAGPVYVEAFSGTRLEYIDGNVYGFTLKAEIPMTLVPAAAPDNVITSNLSQEQDLLIIIGVDDPGLSIIRHINDQNFSSVVKGSSFLIDSTGNITKQ